MLLAEASDFTFVCVRVLKNMYETCLLYVVSTGQPAG